MLILSLFFTLSVHGATFELIGPCLAEPVHQQEQTVLPGSSTGAFTIAILEANKIPFHGSLEAIHSILGTPEGDGALEVINDSEMRAYGWCYEVDGKQPDLIPDKVLLQGPEHVKWFYAFSHYKSGEWLSYCEPAHTVKPKKLCR